MRTVHKQRQTIALAGAIVGDNQHRAPVGDDRHVGERLAETHAFLPPGGVFVLAAGQGVLALLLELAPLQFLGTIGGIVANNSEALVVDGLLVLGLSGAPGGILVLTLLPYRPALSLQRGGLQAELPQPFTCGDSLVSGWRTLLTLVAGDRGGHKGLHYCSIGLIRVRKHLTRPGSGGGGIV